MATKTRDLDYFTEKPNNISEINIYFNKHVLKKGFVNGTFTSVYSL